MCPAIRALLALLASSGDAESPPSPSLTKIPELVQYVDAEYPPKALAEGDDVVGRVVVQVGFGGAARGREAPGDIAVDRTQAHDPNLGEGGGLEHVVPRALEAQRGRGLELSCRLRSARREREAKPGEACRPRDYRRARHRTLV